MKTESPAAYVGLLMLLFVAMAPSDAAYIDSADTEAVGDNNQMYSEDGAREIGIPSLADERRRYEYKKLITQALADLAEEIRNRRPSSVEDQPDIYDDQGLALRDAVKRGRWQGFCFRRTRSGRILPYICWKGSNF